MSLDNLRSERESVGRMVRRGEIKGACEFYEEICAEYDRICTEREREIEKLQAEIERMNPIVIAAMAWCGSTRAGHTWNAKDRLLYAVSAYEEEGDHGKDPDPR